MTEQDIIESIKAVEGVLDVDLISQVEMIDGRTLLLLNVYVPSKPPDLEIKVGDNVGVEAHVR